MQNIRFLTLASIAAFATGLTTIGVHFIDFPAETFEARLQLARDPVYVGQKWMIICHCLMVIISMFGAAWVASRNAAGFAALSALFYAVFGIAEMTRMFAVLAYLNPLRERYMAMDDPALRTLLQQQIENLGGASTVLFLVFILAFALGNLFMGLALSQKNGLSRWMARGFLIWSVLTFIAFSNHFWQVEALGPLIEVCNKIFQPLFRLAIGWWLWRMVSDPSS